MREIYLDNCATTKVDEDTANVALEAMLKEYGNPSSLHGKGQAARDLLETARRRLADALGCSHEEVFFTSGGTESNNLALLGGWEAVRRRGSTLVAMAWEHSSALAPLRYLAERQGCTLRLVNPAPDGNVDPDRLLEAVDGDTVLVSCMLVNSEVGAIAPIADIARAVKRKNRDALVHCDAVQALGKIPFSVRKLGVDLVSASAHKLHAPKGCGALYINREARIVPRSYGGSQEWDIHNKVGIRPGTESVPLACAFGYAADKLTGQMEQNLRHMRALYEYFVNKASSIPGVCINSPSDSTPYLCNLSAVGYRSNILLNELSRQGIYVSSGSACSKGAKSHVLTAMGLPDDRVDGALRVSFSKDTATDELDAFFDALTAAISGGVARSS